MGGSLGRFVIGRLLSVVAVVVLVTAVTWLVFRGLRPEFFADDDRSVFIQLAVADLLREGIVADLWLLGGGLAFGIAAGVTAGAYVASKPRSAAARLIETVAMVFLCAPVYVVGLSALLLFGAGIAVSGIGIVPLRYVEFGESPVRWLGALIVPWNVPGLPLAAACERMMNSSMREVLHEEFVRTALAKGISRRRMLRRHAVPAAVAPVLTLAGGSLPGMVTHPGAVALTFNVPRG